MSEEIPPGDLIDMKSAARLAQCHLGSMYRYVMTGKLRGWKRVGRWFVSEADVRALFRRHRSATELRAEQEKERAKERSERNSFTKSMLREMFGD